MRGMPNLNPVARQVHTVDHCHVISLCTLSTLSEPIRILFVEHDE